MNTTEMTVEEYNKQIQQFIFRYEGDNVEEDLETYKGIVIAGYEEDDVEDLKKVIDVLEEKSNISIDHSCIYRIAFGDIYMNNPGAFCFQTNTIKLNPDHFDREKIMGKYDFHHIFIHEYTHALDINNDIYQNFIDDYKQIISDLGYNLFKSDDYIWKLGIIPTNDILHPSHNEIDEYLQEKGYPSKMGLVNIREFVAMAFMDYFAGISQYNNQFNQKVVDLVQKYFV